MAQCGQALPRAGLLAIGEALTPQETDQILVLGPVLHHHGDFIFPRRGSVSRTKSATPTETVCFWKVAGRWRSSWYGECRGGKCSGPAALGLDVIALVGSCATASTRASRPIR